MPAFRLCSTLSVLFPLSLLLSSTAVAQAPLTGFSPAAAERERALEPVLLQAGDGPAAVRDRRTLSAEPHVAGTPAQQRTAAYVLREMAKAGLDTSRADFSVYMPYPDSTIVELVSPARIRFTLDEPPVPGDTTTYLTPWPAMNGTAGDGDVTAPLVYVNYGLIEDYATLDSLGISVKGKIAIARYGRSFRGIKAREAEKHGAVGLILYSDPQDDGYFRGDVYPEGPMRNADGVQRGSILNEDGDPSTPGWASVKGARRLPTDSMNISRIPVVPLGYGNAAKLLEPMRGPDVPQRWQGGLPFRYHIGGTDAATARVGLWHQQGENAFKTITNTYGIIRGSTWPDEIVIVGGHRDAWGPGARDNVGGVASILQAARAWGSALKTGHRPRRTLILATWDAEEWGLVGATEWVESREDSLRKRVVAYLNLDDAADGRRFGASGTSSLHPFIRELTRAVRQPAESVSVYEAWSGTSRGRGEPRVGDLGGGSDFGAFYNHLGLPSLDFGFGGGGGTYHSAYDTYTFQDRFGDPGGWSIVAAGQLTALTLARLGNADIPAFDYAYLGGYIGRLAQEAEARDSASPDASKFAALSDAARGLAEAGQKFAAARDAAVATPNAKAIKAANAELRQVEISLARPSGLVGRPWFRNLLFAADRNNGYANIALPGIAEAAEDGDSAREAAEISDLTARVRTAAGHLERATELLAKR
ncbi:MAG TPA: M20/M25/M40 family metallo-hydrolase [Gemmatimonadales bacterium]|nr:M20/M25/M40 family metallo-hydrolase [Gemmatimonadales bacterium]